MPLRFSQPSVYSGLPSPEIESRELPLGIFWLKTVTHGHGTTIGFSSEHIAIFENSIREICISN